jgi:hypothetical protein
METLLERVDELIDAQKGHQSFPSTTAQIEELAARSERLEKAIREIALEVQKLSASQEG